MTRSAGEDEEGAEEVSQGLLTEHAGGSTAQHQSQQLQQQQQGRQQRQLHVSSLPPSQPR